MTLYQLLQAYDFDEIMATVNAMFPGTAQYRPQLQQAYDLLLGMNPVESKKSIRYKLLHDADDDISYMGADDANFHTTWEVCLGKQVVREKGVDLSDQELAANCLVNVAFQARGPKAFDQAKAILMRQ